VKFRDYPNQMVQFSCAKCLRSGRYKKSALIEKYTADIPLPDLRNHIASDCERMLNKAGTDPCGISYPDLLKAHLDWQQATGITESEL
jgi:hypothetical protein